MKRLALFFILPLVVGGAVSLAVVHCGDDGGDGCPEGQLECNDGLCHDCCLDDDCLDDPAMGDCPEKYIICNDEYLCDCICYKEGEDCSRDPAACCDTLACDIFTNTCMTACESDADCLERTEIPFYENLKCKTGACDFDHCKVDGDCEPGEACSNGDCVTIPECSELKECVVLPGSAVTKEGTTAQFAATAYLMSGAVAPGQTFTWSSDAATVASVSAGLVTGGAVTGSAKITATVSGCTISCTADVTNYGAVGDETRVVAVDELENTPVEGATVQVGTEAAVTTNADGVAIVSTIKLEPGNAADITVSHQEFNYVTMRGVETNDVIVHMGKLHHLDFKETPPMPVAGGIKGTFDFKMIRCEPPLVSCDVSFGLGGLSIPGNLVNLNFDLLIGGMIKTEIELGGDTQVVPLPSGLVLCLNKTCFKEYFTPTGIPGNRVAWGLGGKLDLSDLIDKLGPVISGGEINIGELVASLLPLFANFYTAMVPNLEVVPKDMVVDFNDIDDGGDDDCCCPAACADTEYCHPHSCTCQTRPANVGDAKCPNMVPDYDNFPGQDMTLKVKMEETITFNAPALPPKPGGGYYYDGVIVIGGVIVRGAGLVPLGLSAGLDSLNDDDTPDGQIADPIVMKVADVAGRIPEEQVDRVIIALAMDVAGLAGETDSPMVLGGQVIYVESFSGTHDLADFMTPATATYVPDSDVLKVVEPGAGADYTQAIFSSKADDKNWHILGEWAVGDYTLPTDPDPTDPRNHGVSFINIDLGTGDYQSLVQFNDGNMGNLVELVTSFCFLEVPECYTNDDCPGEEVCDGTKCKAP